jgi:superfamily II DNA helicase RecQ
MDSKQLRDILQQINPLLDACVGCDESLKDVVSALRMELVLRTATSRLDDYFTLIPVPAKRGVGIVQKDIANKVGFNRYKSKIQQMACEHVGNREDTVMIAPCGSGKSMAFVYAALNSGGKVNIVIEPLNAIIKSQLVELEYLSAHMDIEQLYNEEEAKEKRVLSSYNRMQMIVNETKVSTVELSRSRDMTLTNFSPSPCR